MYLTELEMADVVRKQYKYKLKSYLSVFTSLIAIQLLAMLFSSGGMSSSYSSVNGFSVQTHQISGNLILGFTILWAFITAILITTKAYRYDDFAFVTNRVSSNLSNILFLVTASFIGAVLASLSSYLLKVILFIVYDGQLFLGQEITFTEILVGILGASCYLFIFSAFGYLLGTLVQLHKVFILILPVLFFGSAFLGGAAGESILLEWLYQFFVKETSLLFFAIKIVMFSCIFFVAATAISNRMEVRK